MVTSIAKINYRQNRNRTAFETQDYIVNTLILAPLYSNRQVAE